MRLVRLIEEKWEPKVFVRGPNYKIKYIITKKKKKLDLRGPKPPSAPTWVCPYIYIYIYIFLYNIKLSIQRGKSQIIQIIYIFLSIKLFHFLE